MTLTASAVARSDVNPFRQMLQMTINTLTTKTTQQKETITRLQEELEFLKAHTADEQVKGLLEAKAALTEQIQELTSKVCRSQS